MLSRIAMKQKRKSTTYPTQIGSTDEHIQQMGPSFTDLPKAITQSVLLMLPTHCILVCKCVCKTWHDLILESEFTKMHFEKAEAYPLIRPSGPTQVSRILYLAEFEKDFGLARENYSYDSDSSMEFKPRRFHMNLPKYKVPLRNAEKIINNEDNVNVIRNRKHGTKRMACIKIRPNDHKYKVVNSCNGFVCLSEPISNDPVVVCNPVTGEYMHLPQASQHKSPKLTIHCAIGFSPKTNQYKVIRIFDQGTSLRMAEVHTLGTSSWKLIGSAPQSACVPLEFPTYVDGALYWFVNGDYWSASERWFEYSTLSFDLDNEKFQSVPPLPFEKNSYGIVSLGVLGNCLCLCDAYNTTINLWILTTNGAEKIWKKKMAIKRNHGRWPSGLYILMKYFNDGRILLFNNLTSALIYYHPKAYKCVFLNLRGMSKFSATSYVPSLISLKDILVTDVVNILNINARCAHLKLPGEKKAVFLEKDIPGRGSDFNTFYSSGED